MNSLFDGTLQFLGRSPSALVPALLFLAITAQIARKAGYSWWSAILVFIPIVNIAAILVFLFVPWPIQHKLQRLEKPDAVIEDPTVAFWRRADAPIANITFSLTGILFVGTMLVFVLFILFQGQP